MNKGEQKIAAREFAKEWKGKGYEKGESQKFWLALLRNVYGIEKPEHFISFEDQVHLDHTSFIDGRIKATKVLIEQKGLGQNLKKAIKQSDGTLLSPFQQAKRYITELPVSEHPRWVVTCNFEKFLVYDMEKPQGEPEEILLCNLEKEYYRLNFLVDQGNEHIKREMEISLKAGEIVGLIYEALLKQYHNPQQEDSLKSLNILCVRLVFCLYAEDAGLFGKYLMFHDYMNQFNAKDWRKTLIDLFEVLDTPEIERDPYLEEDLAAFPYVNGGLFTDDKIEIPRFTEEITDLILHKASEDFDWSEISPTIFGAVFESTLNPETRRAGGMHYTSIENIHKVIDPLFLNELKEIFEKARNLKTLQNKRKALENLQNKLANFKFLDPACGSGNFLTETYLSLRKLENEILKELVPLRKSKRGNKGLDKQISIGQSDNEDLTLIKVSINQFYGIEINDFAVTVAKTAMWIAESQMMTQTLEIIYDNSLEFLPLKTSANIIEGNALKLKWEDIVSVRSLSYIMGNPPFVGARIMNEAQKYDVERIFEGWKNKGNLDYVSCWYKKATDLMKGTSIRSAFVATNSITQGESVANLWEPLFNDGIHIDFAYQTFRWDSEANIKAKVHCVIVGFSMMPNFKLRRLFTKDTYKEVKNINGYLIEADNIFIKRRNTPICGVPKIGIGNMPIDNGNYLFTKEEKEEFMKLEPQSESYFYLWYGADEFINRKPRYCLYLGNCPPNILRKMPYCLKRVEAVRE